MELLRDRSPEFEQAGVRAFGISRDSPWTHISWMQALDLTVPLLSDWNAEAVARFRARTLVSRRMEDVPRAFGVPRRPGRYGPPRMALRRRRGAGPGRHRWRPRRLCSPRPGAVYLGAGLLATLPALRHADDSFLAQGLPATGETAPGDHLQAVWQLWLPGHQLERGAAPWLDPYSFQPEVDPRPNFAGWPFGVVFWPLDALLGADRGLERVRPARLRGRGRARVPLAAGARARDRRSARRRARLRAGAVPGHAGLDGPPARTGLDAAAARAVRAGAVAARLGRLARARGRGARLDPALRPGAPGARRDPVLRALRAAPATASLGRRLRLRACGDLRRARRLRGRDRGIDRGKRSIVRGGRALLGRPARPRRARPAPRAGERRLPGLAPTGRRDRRPRRRWCSRGGTASPRRCSWAPWSRACSRSARTSPATSSSGTGCPASTRPGCPGG